MVPESEMRGRPPSLCEGGGAVVVRLEAAARARGSSATSSSIARQAPQRV